MRYKQQPGVNKLRETINLTQNCLAAEKIELYIKICE